MNMSPIIFIAKSSQTFTNSYNYLTSLIAEIVFTGDVLMLDGTYYKLVRQEMNWTESKVYFSPYPAGTRSDLSLSPV